MSQKDKNNSSIIERFRKATWYSIEGLRMAWQEEQAFRLEILAGIVLFPLAVIVPVDAVIRVLLVLSMILVLVVELLNSAVEAVTDLSSKELHHLAKKAKDCASAAVFLCLLGSGALWIFALCLWYQQSV
jgi:diacylglycerol kinase (ATP)